MTNTLVLFDIDGTLLDTRGAGRRSFARAVQHVLGGQDDMADVPFAGATDMDLFEKMARRNGREATQAERTQFFEILPDLLRKEMLSSPPFVYPGVVELLRELSEHPAVTLGLVTGNIEACAWVKLQGCGIDAHFELGAFGHEHGDRREIARLARARAEQTRRYNRCILIGDTPSDINAAHAIDAISVAVATGVYSAAQLTAAGAAHVWENLAVDAHHARALLLAV